MKANYFINQKFDGVYPPEAAVWCNERGDCYIQRVSDGYQIVKIPEPTDAELAEDIRNKRDNLISETDFYLMPDYPIDSKNLEELKTYRQALRDIPEQSGFPKEVTWPEQPSFLCKDANTLGLAKVGL